MAIGIGIGIPFNRQQVRWFKGTIGAEAWRVVRPKGGYDYVYDPDTATLGETYNVLATVIYDVLVTGGDWSGSTVNTVLRTLVPDSATMGNLFDTLATLISELPNTVSVYTITEPTGGRVRSFNPMNTTLGYAIDVMASLLLDLQDAGTIG